MADYLELKGQGKQLGKKEKMEEGFDHEAHMEKIARGLIAIVNCKDIEEAKKIAGELLQEEEKEESTLEDDKEPENENDLKSKLMKAL